MGLSLHDAYAKGGYGGLWKPLIDSSALRHACQLNENRFRIQAGGGLCEVCDCKDVDGDS